jgi:hypothetical protein
MPKRRLRGALLVTRLKSEPLAKLYNFNVAL